MSTAIPPEWQYEARTDEYVHESGGRLSALTIMQMEAMAEKQRVAFIESFRLKTTVEAANFRRLSLMYFGVAP